MKPLIFLGSGVSFPSFGSASSVPELTRALSAESWVRTSDGSWLPKAGAQPSLWQPACQEFLRRTQTRTKRYYKEGRGTEVNYEDLFSLANQVADEAGWTDNPAIRPFRTALASRVKDLLAKGLTFERLAIESLTFIQHVIAHQLRRLFVPPVI